MHPADEIRGIKSKKLSNKNIILGLTGSIAAVESIRVARDLIRHGAYVYPVMTKAATKIIHPYSLEFATSNKPITEITGKTEHVSFCGLTKDKVDLLLISPCTANTISKIAHGIDDTPVTTFATTAIGSKTKITIVPAMHLSMYNHKIVQENINKCKRMGISFIDPVIQGNKAKLPNMDEIIENTIRRIGKNDLEKKNILIVGGATAEAIDDIRIITNRSSGKTAVSLAKNAFERGANVELWYGTAKEIVPQYTPVKRFETVRDLLNLIKKYQNNFDTIIVCAAIANYIPKKHKGKIPSGKKSLTIELTSAPNIIEKFRSVSPKSKIIAFKVEKNKKNLKEKSYQLLKKFKIDFVIANTTSAFGKDKNDILILNKKGKSENKKGRKEDLANFILDLII
jgi:phosphopantothenoylcysteine decarboxylase/phosphopantothenate--cysteine ligase